LKLPISNAKYILLILIFSFSIFSCDRVKKKGENVIAKAKNGASKQLDKIFPTYDAYKPDTDHNKRRFKEHLQVELTDDVKNIYSYGDFLGINYKVLIAFTCSKTTINSIIEIKKMQKTPSKDDDGLFFLAEFKWWDKDKIELLTPYKIGEKGKHWQYLWYDRKTKQAFYEEYSL